MQQHTAASSPAGGGRCLLRRCRAGKTAGACGRVRTQLYRQAILCQRFDADEMSTNTNARSGNAVCCREIAGARSIPLDLWALSSSGFGF
jgi:hypothetical protein